MTEAFLDTTALADLDLPDTDGNLRRIGDLWADRPLILVFLRHFG